MGMLAARQDGFTLVEVLTVLVVLAIAAGLVVTRFAARHDTEVLQTAAYELASRCRAARSAAIRKGSEQTIVIDMANRLVTAGPNVPPLRISKGIDIVSETSATERHSRGAVGIRFFANGASTGGTVRLESGRHAYEVRVNWFTGRVVVERKS
jgi:general secretion pathway protein H